MRQARSDSAKVQCRQWSFVDNYFLEDFKAQRQSYYLLQSECPSSKRQDRQENKGTSGKKGDIVAHHKPMA